MEWWQRRLSPMIGTRICFLLDFCPSGLEEGGGEWKETICGNRDGPWIMDITLMILSFFLFLSSKLPLSRLWNTLASKDLLFDHNHIDRQHYTAADGT